MKLVLGLQIVGLVIGSGSEPEVQGLIQAVSFLKGSLVAQVDDEFGESCKDVFQTFGKHDLDGNGKITPQEMTKAAKSHGGNAEEVKKMFDLSDVDKDDLVSYKEFAAVYGQPKCADGCDMVFKMFREMDPDHDGKISKEELIKTFVAGKHGTDLAGAQESFAEFAGADGVMSYMEFATMADLPKCAGGSPKKKEEEKKEEAGGYVDHQGKPTDISRQFGLFDCINQDGTITREEMHKKLKSIHGHYSQKESDKFFSSGDVNGDDKLTIQEFGVMMKKEGLLQAASFMKINPTA